MLATHPVGYLRFLISIAALGLLAALLLLPAPVRAQDTTAPTLLVARVSGTSLVLVYNEAIDTGSVPAASAYSVVVASATGVAPTGVGISGARVTLTLSTAAASGDTVTVGYTAPSTGNKLQDLAGNDAAALTDEVVVNYTDTTNHLPVFPTAPTTRSVAENTANATQFGSPVTATDGDSDTLFYTLPTNFNLFAVDNNGQLQTVANLDYEMGPTSYVVPVYVSDRKNAAGDMADTEIDDTILVTISVTNVNEAPSISGTINPSVPEDTTAVGTYTVTDMDVGDSHTWTVESSDDGALFVFNQPGVLSFRNAPDYDMPVNVGNEYHVAIKVTDNGSPTESATSDITVEVTDVNEAPVITTTGSTYMAFSVAENTATSVVLQTYMADDPDAGDSLTWSKTGNDAGAFTIVGGALKFSSVPNYESPAGNGTNNVYNVTVNVRDSNGGTVDASIAVAVTVTNVDEAGTASFSGTLSGGSTQTAGLTDPDGSTTSKSYRWQRGTRHQGTSQTLAPMGPPRPMCRWLWTLGNG